jgi:leukotriene-A4 hydrolase
MLKCAPTATHLETEGPRISVRIRSHSFSEPEKVRLRHVHLDIRPRFDLRELQCIATLDIQRADAWLDAPIVLDTQQLHIQEVKAAPNSTPFTPAEYEVGEADRVLGRALKIAAPKSADRIEITYSTDPDASALQWLEPGQTALGDLPFLFTQSQAIHARSWIPIQDSPAVRISFSALVHPPPKMMALMSAGNNPVRPHRGDYYFFMEHPVPPYLIALSIGQLEFARTGFRTGVYAEPPLLRRAEYEFIDTERMIEVAERLYGPYRWGRFDLLVLPPSFPYGGMENPRLTFLTPTLITGDRGLVSVIAHELAHSWSGNLVTNASWGDFWLNEGFTTYIEHRIQEEIYGKDRVQAEEALSRLSLDEEMSKLEQRDQLLDTDLTGRDPDEAMTDVPYVKGALFLQSLEHTFGRRRFDRFLRQYFDHFAFQSITTAQAINYLRSELLNTQTSPAVSVPLSDWLSKPGLPESSPKPNAKLLNKIRNIAQEWAAGQSRLDSEEISAWDTHQWLYFLNALPPEVTAGEMSELDSQFGFSKTTNSELLARWLLLSIRYRYRTAYPHIEKFLTSVGRLKYIKPIYEEMAKIPEERLRAAKIFEEAKSFYHPIARTAIEQILSRSNSKVSVPLES